MVKELKKKRSIAYIKASYNIQESSTSTTFYNIEEIQNQIELKLEVKQIRRLWKLHEYKLKEDS
ncbi:hypothetical protein Ahy_A06g030167 isoform B [Arachis hypogaea]|uniref:Uncharacterized protein n=1 Tax=Arachis hypogaea TaxID=3818 RepID=A0A445CVF5_ARAHY|nr:hypothetical protein Ahy_A06g030167 isoform B [Arachis hypogaea]